MEIIVNKHELIDVLSKIQGLTGRRSSLAITECVRITTSDTEVELTATDLETCYRGIFPATIRDGGTMAISARKFYEIIREFPSSEILIAESDQRWINIGNKNEKVQYHIISMNADDFPELPVFDEIDFFEVPCLEFKKMIDKSITISGIGEDKKPHINGVRFENLVDAGPGRLRMISTDGSRLSNFEYVYPPEMKIPIDTGILIPKKGLHEASKFIGNSGNISIGIQGSYLIIKGHSETLAIRLLEGQFPEYKEVISVEKSCAIPMEKEPLMNMLKRMSILCTDNYRAAIFTFDRESLTINATNPDIGESKEDMAIDYQGEKLEVAFNPKFFIEALNCIDDEKILVHIMSEEKPCIIEGAEDKTYLNAIMPMRV